MPRRKPNGTNQALPANVAESAHSCRASSSVSAMMMSRSMPMPSPGLRPETEA